MQSENQSSENVINLFGKKPAPKNLDSQENADENYTFAEIMRRNAENKERERKERVKANKGVIRSYRLHKK